MSIEMCTASVFPVSWVLNVKTIKHLSEMERHTDTQVKVVSANPDVSVHPSTVSPTAAITS